jgi:GH15 family glucan-1,4-alpha-glucosidase
MANLDLGVIGNCSYAGLIDKTAKVVWCCLPRFDGDPVFNQLLRGEADDPFDGAFSIELEDIQSSEQHYEPKTAVLVTTLRGASGSLQVVDCAPRFMWRDRIFRPQTLVRRIRPLSGRPRITIRLRPTFNHGLEKAETSHGSNHIRYFGRHAALRLVTDAPTDYILAEKPVNLTAPLDLILGPDETLQGSIGDTARSFVERTTHHWLHWVSRLALPFEWQDAVIRAAITLKLCTYEQTGAIVAAMTTSIPESPNSGRNWDYRFCWLRDAFSSSGPSIRSARSRPWRIISDSSWMSLPTPMAAISSPFSVSGASGTSLSGYCRNSPVIAAWGQSASGTRRTNITSTTSTAMSSSARHRCSSTSASA